MRQIRIIISRVFYVPISPTFCGQYIYQTEAFCQPKLKRTSKDLVVLCSVSAFSLLPLKGRTLHQAEPVVLDIFFYLERVEF